MTSRVNRPHIMRLIERYILKSLSFSFLASLLVLTGIVWMTQILRDFDLVTAQGQTIFTMIHVTVLSLPALVVVIAPIALFISVVFTFTRLNSDSELITMHAAGLSPLRLALPPLVLSLLVTLLLVWMTLDMVPRSFRGLRNLITVVRADVVTNIIKEGRFTTIEKGITFHVRERGPKGQLIGLFVQDRRDPNLILTYISEGGRVIEDKEASYLLLEKGSLQRQTGRYADAALVQFDQYAIDLSQFSEIAGPTVYKPRERTTAELLNPDKQEYLYKVQPGRFRSELHDRFAIPLYTIVFAGIGYCLLGLPKTTRQGRAIATGVAIAAMIGMRMLGFSATSLSGRAEWGVALVYAIPIIGLISVAVWIFMAQNKIIKMRI